MKIDDLISRRAAVSATDIVESECPYDIDGAAFVTRIDTDETWEI